MAHSESGKLRISQSLIGNTHALGHKQSDEAKLKKSLAMKGKIPWNKGKALSNETRKKMSVARKGLIHPWMHRSPSNETKVKLSKASRQAWKNPSSRQKYVDALQKTKWLKVRTDKGQVELLNKWNQLGFDFRPNYQLCDRDTLFYIDGYDPTHNIVMEYDGKYHHRSKQKQKDLVRQQKIIDILKPKKFWRYDAMNKTFTNILG